MKRLVDLLFARFARKAEPKADAFDKRLQGMSARQTRVTPASGQAPHLFRREPSHA